VHKHHTIKMYGGVHSQPQH